MATEVKHSNIRLIERINAWVETFGHNQDPYLVGLTHAIENNSDLDYWETINPLDYLPTTDAHSSIRELKIARLVAGVRNVIIFLPVAITWAAVSEATTAFNEFVKTNTGTPANFLQFWQDGYGLLDNFWRISSVAQLDFLLVLLVIFMSAAVSITQARGLSKAARLQVIFSRERRTLGLQIRQYLFAHRTVVTTNVPNEVQKAVESLRVAMRDSQDHVQGLRDSTVSLANSLPAISAKAVEVEKLVDSLNNNLESKVENFGQQIIKASEIVGKSLEVVLGQTAKSVERILSDIDNTSTAMKSSARAVQDQIESLQREITRK